MPRVWSRGDRVIYEPDPMLYGVMEVSEGNGAGGASGMVLCRAFNAPRRDSFDLFDADVLAEAPMTEPQPEPEPVTQPGLPEGGKK